MLWSSNYLRKNRFVSAAVCRCDGRDVETNTNEGRKEKRGQQREMWNNVYNNVPVDNKQNILYLYSVYALCMCATMC